MAEGGPSVREVARVFPALKTDSLLLREPFTAASFLPRKSFCRLSGSCLTDDLSPATVPVAGRNVS